MIYNFLRFKNVLETRGGFNLKHERGVPGRPRPSMATAREALLPARMPEEGRTKGTVW